MQALRRSGTWKRTTTIHTKTYQSAFTKKDDKKSTTQNQIPKAIQKDIKTCGFASFFRKFPHGSEKIFPLRESLSPHLQDTLL